MAKEKYDKDERDDASPSKEQKALVAMARALHDEFIKRIPNIPNMSAGEVRDTVVTAQDLLWLTHHALTFDSQADDETKPSWAN